MHTPLKTAIIGCGAISQTHINAINSNEISQITALCDINENSLNSTTLICRDAKKYSNYKELLKNADCDVVHVCTPHYMHKEMAIAAMEAGHDVYLEKPTALNLSDAKDIIKTSETTGRKVCVSFQNRLINSTISAKELLDNGAMGKIIGLKGIVTWKRCGEYYTESGWRGTWDREGGGVLMNQSIHTIDLLYYLGGKISKVEGSVALRKNKGTIEVEDTAEATLYYENGATAIFYATNCHTTSSPIEIEIVCENGSLIIRDDVLYKLENNVMTPVAQNGALAVGKSVWGMGHAAMIGNFYENIMGNNKYYCDVRDSIASLEIIEQIYSTSANKLR